MNITQANKQKGFTLTPNFGVTLRSKGGFTLIEILVVIGIIAILATVVLIAINPARQFKQAHDSQRISNVNAILNAYGQRVADNKGNFATGCTAGDVPAAAVDQATAVKIATGGGNWDARSCLVPTYMPSLPYDPTTGAACSPSETACTTYDTSYKVYKDASSRVTIFATGEITSIISVTR